MKKLESIDLHKEYYAYPTIFFISDGIIIDNTTHSPLINFNKAVQLLQLTIHSACVENRIMTAKVETPLNSADILDKGFIIYPIKSFLSMPESEHLYKLILKSIHWLEWDLSVQHCSQCGAKVSHAAHLNQKTCDSCHFSFFPKFSPAVMVLVQNDHQILLARSPHFRPHLYSAIAGFIDAGETAEEAAMREVEEEVGLRITDLEYFGTQSWPFPDRFMIAFKAKYLSGNIHIDTNELEDARWFDLHNLPELPYGSSLSRRLIDHCILNMQR